MSYASTPVLRPVTDTNPFAGVPVETDDRSEGRSWAKFSARKVLSTIATLLVFGVAWFTLAPPALGGRTSYMVTDGVSMLPHFKAGDVVVFWSEPTYRVGEVAAYHNGELGVVVMHRIVGVKGTHFIFKGDNNNFHDSYEPTASQIIGVERVHLSGGGRYVDMIRSPLVVAVLFALAWIVSFGPARDSSARRGGRRDVDTTRDDRNRRQ